MKRKFVLLMMLFVLLLSSIANADGGEDASLLPNDILQILSGTEWSSYKVGRVNCGSSLADYYSDACCWYDQYGHAAAFVLMHSENKNVLCLFEKNSAGKWVLKAKSSEIVKQGERIPLITSEEYGIYYVSYIDDDRKSELSLEIEKKKDGWYVTRINWDKDNVFMELSLYENKIEYLKIVYANGGSKSTRTTVEGVTPPTSFAEFSLDNIPMTPEKARAQLSLPPDIPQATGEYSRRTSSSRQTRNTPSILDPAKTTSAAAMARRRSPQTTGFRCSAGKMAGLCFSTILPAITCASAGFRKAHCRRTRMSAMCSLVKQRCGRRFQAT